MTPRWNLPADQLPVGLEDAEQTRLTAMRANDAKTLKALTTGGMRYLHEAGVTYTRDAYVNAVATRGLVYAPDVSLEEEYNYLEGDVFMSTGVMRGHARLIGEQQVFHLRYSATWIRHTNGWRLLLVQKTPILPDPLARAG